jgi:membrane protein implicated in regulation of membrane protease activity
MPDSGADPFSPDSIAANRRGELSDGQRRGFGALAASNHRSAFGSAALLAAGVVLIGFSNSSSVSTATRLLFMFVGTAIAVILVVRAVTGTDALSRDVREGRVDSAEGAVGKRHLSTGGGPAAAVSFLDVGTQHFRVSPATFKAAPDAGFVRVFFLPRSRKIVNFEHLSNPVPEDLNVQLLRDKISASFRAPDRELRNEARATLAGVTEAWESSLKVPDAAAPAAAADARPLAQAILGPWSNGVIKVTFASDGTVTTLMFGATQTGRWSVDGDGKLRAELAGRSGVVDARIAGDQLTVNMDGSAMTFRRATRT